MKGKRYTTAQRIRLLREADQAGSTIAGVCQERTITMVPTVDDSGPSVTSK